MVFKGVEICCPACKSDLTKIGGERYGLQCVTCSARYPVVLGIPDLRVFPDPYLELEADWAKGAKLAERARDLDFSDLVDFYYRNTPAVPPRHARLYTRGLLAGVARAEATLEGWERAMGGNGRPAPRALLEIGCGTGPLLVSAAPRVAGLVGVDIAFRWLVVAEKRLAESGLDVPLICACAEALPFPDGAFDRVVADSVLEHVQDQRRTLAECHRVMRPAGCLFISTPNRYSLGPDPQAGIWAGGYLPHRWLAAYVRWQGGISPKRRLLSARSLGRLIREAGFCPPRVLLPDISSGQRNHFGNGVKMLIDLYHVAKRMPVGRQLLRWVGPLLHAVSEKPTVPTVVSVDRE